MTKMNVESFNLDHTKVVAPFIRLAGTMEGLTEMSFTNTTFVSNNQTKNIWICPDYIH